MRSRLIIATALILALAAGFLIPLMNSCNNDDGKNGPGDTTKSVPPPLSISYSIGDVYPHDTGSFTEGITFYKGELYEGTGLEGFSKIMKIDLKTGKPIQQLNMAPDIFGEGITILNDTLYQLTYQDKTAYAYTVKDFRKVKQFSFETQTREGWGLTHNGTHLIASDGGNNLYFYEPSTFKLLKTLPITESGSLSYNINELEYIDGFIYANQWTLPYILKIDLGTGKVVGKINIADVWNRAKQKEMKSEVPNGIAYDSTSKKIYITGKHWPELYELQLSK